MNNLDLVFWTNKDIYIYNLSDKNYVKYQEIDESNQEKKDDESEFNDFKYFG